MSFVSKGERYILREEKEYLLTLRRSHFDIINGVSSEIDYLYEQLRNTASKDEKQSIYDKIQSLKEDKRIEIKILNLEKVRLDEIDFLIKGPFR